MIHAATMGAVAMSCVEGAIVNEPFKANVCMCGLCDGIANTDLLGVSADGGRARISGKDAFETGGTVAIICCIANTGVNPIDAVRTANASSMGCTPIGGPFSALGASILRASLASSMSFAPISGPLSTLGAFILRASLASSMSFAPISGSSSTLGAPRMRTFPTHSMLLTVLPSCDP